MAPTTNTELDLVALTGKSLAYSLFNPLPGGAQLMQALTPAMTACIRAALNPVATTSERHQLLTLFASDGTLPPENLVYFADFAAELLDQLDEQDARLIQQITDLLAPACAQPLYTKVSAATKKTATPASNASISYAQMDKVLQSLADTEPFKTALAALQQDTVQAFIKNSFQPTAVLVAATYDPDKVKAALRALIKFLQKFAQNTLKPILIYVEKEIAAATLRSVIAEAMATAIEQIPIQITSSAKIGNYVHKVLQNTYVERYAAIHDIAIERYNYTVNRTEQVIIGPVTAFVEKPLDKVALDRIRDPDWFFQTLRFALNGWHIYNNGWLRADLIDAATHEIWEIKPIRSAAGGVWQETLYRVSFNVLRMFFTARLPDVIKIPRYLQPGSFWMPGNGSWMVNPRLSARLLNPIDVTAQAGEPAIAVPYQVSVLPGLICYVVLRGPNIKALWPVIYVVVAAAFKAALDYIEKLLQELDEKWEGARAYAREQLKNIKNLSPAEIVEVILICLLIIAIIYAVFMVVGAGSGGAAGSPAGPPGAGIGAGLGALGGAVAATALIILIITQITDDSATGATLTSATPSRTDVLIGPVLLQGMPTDKVGPFFAATVQQFDLLAKRVAAELQSKSTPLTPQV